MSRGVAERVAAVRQLLRAARAVHADRARLAAAIAHASGLTPAGVELGFASLERDASDADLRSLVDAAGDAPVVHVLLAANVFVAPLRALALARAAAPRVTVRPSSRDPVLTCALVEAAGDDAIRLVDPDDRGVAWLDAGEIHVYGRDETIAAVRASARVAVRGHGAGMGVALVTRAADIDQAAEAVASDVAPFDQRGCLSPRVALVEGDAARGKAFAAALHARMRGWGERVPRGALTPDERAEAARWLASAAFVGDLSESEGGAVALAPPSSPLVPPPAGRHVLVASASTAADAFARLGPLAPFVVAVGTDDPASAAAHAPRHARVSPLGRMQHPPLDGPVDRRGG
jgi:hypothetical protein